MEKNIYLEIAKLLGQPINYQLPVPVELSAIADTDTVEPGEKVWVYDDVDTDVDTILAVNTSTGKIEVKKRDPLGETELSFTSLNSQLEYVLVDAVLQSPDTQVLARKKEAITRGMDKRELKLILDAIETISGGSVEIPASESIQSYDATSNEDLYDVIVAMKQLVEDYGDGYVLLCSSQVKSKLDTYDKDNASSFNYRIGIDETLRRLGIEVVKVFGKVELTVGGGEKSLITDNYMMLIAKNSRVTAGKPIKFVRRKINADIAKLMGADVDNAQRATFTNPTPVNVPGTGNVLAYGVYGYESVVFAITNPKAIVVSDATLAL
jgi:hypothetical protein